MGLTKKVESVISSCRTKIQLEGAVKYLKLAKKEGLSEPNYIYFAGAINGMSHLIYNKSSL